MSSHTTRAAGADIRAFRRSAGMLCTTPPAIPFLLMLNFSLIAVPTLEPASHHVDFPGLRGNDVVGKFFHLSALR